MMQLSPWLRLKLRERSRVVPMGFVMVMSFRRTMGGRGDDDD